MEKKKIFFVGQKIDKLRRRRTSWFAMIGRRPTWARPSAPSIPMIPIVEGCGSSSLLATRVGTSKRRFLFIIEGEPFRWIAKSGELVATFRDFRTRVAPTTKIR
jgi:hypothetical protein